MKTLVLGANGKTGRRVADRLEARGVAVRRGTRSGAPSFDWDDPSTWSAVLDGMAAVYVSYFPDLAVPGAVDAVRELSELAERAGVRRLVLLSGRGEEEAQAAEAVVMAGSIEWTVVRCSWFNQNFSESYLLDPVLSGEVGRDIIYRQTDLDGYVAAMAQHDMPRDVVELVGYLFGEVLGGRNEWLGDGVEQALGRPAKDFSAFARDNVAAWTPQPVR